MKMAGGIPSSIASRCFSIEYTTHMISFETLIKRLQTSNVIKLTVKTDKHNRTKTTLSLFWGLIKIQR